MKKTLSLLLCIVLLLCTLVSCKDEEIRVQDLPFEKYAGYKVLNLTHEEGCLCIRFVKPGHWSKGKDQKRTDTDVPIHQTLVLFEETLSLTLLQSYYQPKGNQTIDEFEIDGVLSPSGKPACVRMHRDGSIQSLYGYPFKGIEVTASMSDDEVKAVLTATVGDLFDLSEYTHFSCEWTSSNSYKAKFYREKDGYKVGDGLTVSGQDDTLVSVAQSQRPEKLDGLSFPAPEKLDEIIEAFLNENLVEDDIDSYTYSCEIVKFYDGYGIYAEITLYRDGDDYPSGDVPIFILVE